MHWIIRYISIALLTGSFFLTPQQCLANADHHSIDVAILTMPKGGTNLFIKALYLITGHWPPLGGVVWINGKKVLFDHLWPGYHRLKKNPRVLKIIQIRDPRDMLISQMFWIQNTNNWAGLLPKNYIDKFQSLSESEKITFLINLPEQYFGCTYFAKILPHWIYQPNTIVFRFEDLVGPKGGGSQESQEALIGTLARCFGYELDQEAIAQIASQLHGNAPTFREGKIGSWKKYFSPEHKRLFKAKAALQLIQLGYESDGKW
jgi:hypothetical protein